MPPLPTDPITQYVLPPSETWVRESLVKAIQGTPRRILDLGCGTGTHNVDVEKALFPVRKSSVSTSPRICWWWLTTRPGKPISTLLAATVMLWKLGSQKGSFDVVCATLLFHRNAVPQVTKAILRESFRLLSPWGQVLILDGNQKTLRNADWLSNIFGRTLHPRI